MIESQQAGMHVKMYEFPSLADSLGGGIGLNNRYTFLIVKKLVDELITVDEIHIAEGIRHAYWKERQVIEGGAAVGIAVFLNDISARYGICMVLLTGGNIDMNLHKKIIAGLDLSLKENP